MVRVDDIVSFPGTLQNVFDVVIVTGYWALFTKLLPPHWFYLPNLRGHRNRTYPDKCTPRQRARIPTVNDKKQTRVYPGRSCWRSRNTRNREDLNPCMQFIVHRTLGHDDKCDHPRSARHCRSTRLKTNGIVFQKGERYRPTCTTHLLKYELYARTSTQPEWVSGVHTDYATS